MTASTITRFRHPQLPPKFVREHLAPKAPHEEMSKEAELMSFKMSRAIPPHVQIPGELLATTAGMDAAWAAGDVDAFRSELTKYSMMIWHWFKETPEGKAFIQGNR